MQLINELKGVVQAKSRAARHLHESKGDRAWTPADQAMFDNLLDDAERADERVRAMQLAGRHSSSAFAREREGIECFLRKSSAAMSMEERLSVKNAMSTTTPSEGGFTAGAIVASDLVNLLKGYGFMRRVASQITTSTGASMSYPTSDGTAESGEQLAENAASTLLDPSFGSRNIDTYRFSSRLFTVPVELLQDSSIDIVALVLQRARDRVARIQNLRFTTGTGTGQPTGLVTAASVGKTGTTGQTATIIYDDLVDLLESVDDAHLGMPSADAQWQQVGAGWMMSQAMRKVVRKLKDTNGRPIWLPSYENMPAQLLDYPAYINNDMAAPAANARSLAFGNLASYMIRDSLEFTLLRFDDSAFALKGQVGFLGYARAGGNLLDVNAVKVYQHSAT